MSTEETEILQATSHLTEVPIHAVLDAAIGKRTPLAAKTVGRGERLVYCWQDGTERSDHQRVVDLGEALVADGADPALAYLPGIQIGVLSMRRCLRLAARSHPTHLHVAADYSQAAGTFGAVTALALADNITTENEYRAGLEAAIQETRAQLAALSRLDAARVRRAV